jgi:Leucine-rich repeat (LRR) protein
MCGICRNDYDNNSINFIDCCGNVKKIPKDLINLKILYCFDAQVKKIPKTLINLKTLRIHNTQIKFIPDTLINLEILGCTNTQIKFIPDTLINLVILGCCNNILISPQTIKIEPNNKYYLTFVRCQVRYRNKLSLRKLKFAYDPKYIIGHTTKKQLVKLFQN